MPLAKTPLTEPIPGYRLVSPLGRGGFGEVWKCEAPGGLFKAIKFVEGAQDSLDDDAPAEDEWQAIERIKAIRHPFLLSMDRVEHVGDELVIVMELADRNLADRLNECLRRGLPGIGRDELLGYLLEAAEVLDLMNFQHGLQHLDIKPQNLFLVSNHVKVADFGLVNSLGRAVVQPGAFTPLYAAPETFRGVISPHCDQYSLAIVYQELLTGTLPYPGKNARQLMMQHTQAEPNLGPLPPADRLTVARALAKEPQQRFPSCMAFVRALTSAHIPEGVGAPRSDRGAPSADREETAARHSPSGPSQSHIPNSGGHAADTPPAAVRNTARSQGPSLPGHRVLNRISSGPIAEVWKVEAPGGRTRLAKLVYGFVRNDQQGEGKAIAQLACLRHLCLLPFEVAECIPGRIVLLSDCVEKTLRDRFNECRAQGLSGLPRHELLGHLRSMAEALDGLAEQHGIFHLGLNPRSVLLEDGRTLLGDFGLAHLLWVPAGQDVAQLNARYAAPELFERQINAQCDEYSLALIYQEMLTGTHPHSGQARRELAKSRSGCLPGLDLLPAGDRPVIARALDWDPQKRWPTCTALVRALEASSAENVAAEDPVESCPPLQQAITELVATVAGDLRQRQATAAQRPQMVRTRHHVRMAEKVVRLKADACRLQWNGQVTKNEPGLYVFTVSRPLGFWQRWLGRQAGLEVQLRLTAAGEGTDATVEVRPYGCGPEDGVKLVEGVVPLLMDSLGAALQVLPERRGQERVAWQYPLWVRFVLENDELSEPVECRGKDISLTGMGFYLPPGLPSSRVVLTLTTPAQDAVLDVPASIVRVKECNEDWYEVGARFLFEGSQPPAN